MRNDANIKCWRGSGGSGGVGPEGHKRVTPSLPRDDEKAKGRNSFRRNDLQTGLYKIERQLRIRGAPIGEGIEDGPSARQQLARDSLMQLL